MSSLQGNPICSKANEANVIRFCRPGIGGEEGPGSSDNSSIATCSPLSCASSDSFEFVPNSPSSCQCFCAAPLGVVLRLRSPSITDFRPYENPFEVYVTTNLLLYTYQLYIDSFEWQESHRLWMNLKFFPQCSTTMHQFNDSEIHRLMNAIATFTLPPNETFGPYDLLNFTLLGPYSYIKVVLESSKSGLSKGVVSAIVLGAIFCATSLFFAVAVVFWLKQNKHKKSKEQQREFISSEGYMQLTFSLVTKVPIKIEGVRGFSFEELEVATNNFSISAQVGQGGYGKVYRGILTDGTIVAIKRAQEGSLQGQKEFFTEIETLSRLHHRNLVSLVGYCNEEGEQMLVYDFMPNGSLRDLLSDRFKKLLNFGRRLQIALDSSKGILYLHTEADPPIIHRDIKTNNILLDSKFTAKVSDFGISKIVPVADGDEVLTGHISTTVRGTPGYLDPEYFLTHKLTEKSDVYGIGIVFLELLTGMRPISHGRNIVREVLGACQSGMMFSTIDRSMGPYPSECIKRFMALALKCCEDESALRPSMLEVVRELENISMMLPKGDAVLPDLDAFSSGGSVFSRLAQFSNSEPFVTADLGGSDLVSGVIPSIRPR
ncbi:Protein kinase domain [Dillenia turbinata]|uniref:non-specific serine/threonine protein kinase n=1 Tax=Dillenia turbinata TaxID=194707 RepID=A0AAN8W7Z1_9MAGN